MKAKKGRKFLSRHVYPTKESALRAIKDINPNLILKGARKGQWVFEME